MLEPRSGSAAHRSSMNGDESESELESEFDLKRLLIVQKQLADQYRNQVRPNSTWTLIRRSNLSLFMNLFTLKLWLIWLDNQIFNSLTFRLHITIVVFSALNVSFFCFKLSHILLYYFCVFNLWLNKWIFKIYRMFFDSLPSITFGTYSLHL